MFDHIMYFLLVCVWQRKVDNSLYILQDLCVQQDKNALNEYVQCVIGYIWFGPFDNMK